MDDVTTALLNDLRDLHKQATAERSHYYTGAVINRCIDEINRLSHLVDMARRPTMAR